MLWKYGISLNAHEVTIQFVTSSKEEARNWFTKIKAKCNVVLLHMSNTYTVGKMLAKEPYTRIHIGINKETNTEYIIKSVIKKQLFENSLSLVYKDF